MTKLLSTSELFNQRNILKSYSYQSMIDFGQFEGKTLGELIRSEGWGFVEDAILNRKEFFLDEELFNDYQEFYVSNHEVIEAQEIKQVIHQGPLALIQHIKSKRGKEQKRVRRDHLFVDNYGL